MNSNCESDLAERNENDDFMRMKKTEVLSGANTDSFSLY